MHLQFKGKDCHRIADYKTTCLKIQKNLLINERISIFGKII